MASVPGSRSAGKIVRTRRSAAARSRTPYDRPAPPPPPEPPSPNWISRFVISPSRFIASGAGKIFSSVLDLDNSPSDSSSATSSHSSSANDSDAEEVGTFDDENDNPSEGDVALSKPCVGNSKSKHMIEQLLMKESFSREECDRLIKIIRSRVVDPANDDDGDKRPTDIPNKIFGSDTDSPELHSAAIMEAKKWLREKKSGLDTNSDIGYGSPSLNLVALPQDPKDEGSPVDVAKLYMRTRPPWASPSIDHTKPQTPSGIQLFKEETPYLFGNNSTPPSKLKRDSAATGSWSIQDEIRRVRSRATEDLLRSLPSSKIDWSAFAMENKNNVNSSAIENIGASLGERVHNSTNLVDASANLARGLGSQVSPDLDSKLDEFQPESVLSNPVNINFEQNQGSVAVQQTRGTQDGGEITTSGLRDGSSDDMHRDGGLVKVNGISDTNGPGHQLDSVEETREAINSRLQDSNHLVIKEKVRAEDALANGFPSSEPSFNPGQVIEQSTKTLDNKPNTTDSSQERTAQGLEQEECQTLRESAEVPDVIGDDSVAGGVVSGSQNSSSVYEVQPGVESGLSTTPTSIAKQKGRRIATRYNRRGKGVK
ncbi:protein KAKU4-like isoform X3 [Glycine soja]|uniref:Protein KAKU4 isoform C n=1 Tax=Glycine soja TaxID=3848 RepID=A0A445K649_GLYSO|nr:protein KAKU4-like isoform X3 [Glycine soja]RZC06295.1 Protein KAKU4 isoform C [Glycine soja]